LATGIKEIVLVNLLSSTFLVMQNIQLTRWFIGMLKAMLPGSIPAVILVAYTGGKRHD